MKLLLGLFLTAFYALSLNAQSPCTDGRYANDVFNDFVKTYVVLHNMLLSELLACIWIPQASEWSESVSAFSSSE